MNLAPGSAPRSLSKISVDEPKNKALSCKIGATCGNEEAPFAIHLDGLKARALISHDLDVTTKFHHPCATLAICMNLVRYTENGQ